MVLMTVSYIYSSIQAHNHNEIVLSCVPPVEPI